MVCNKWNGISQNKIKYGSSTSHSTFWPIKLSILLAWLELLWFFRNVDSFHCPSNNLRLIPRQQVAIACASCAAHRRATDHWFWKGTRFQQSFVPSFSLQSPGLWLHLGHTYAQDGAGRLRPPRRLHGPQGLARAEGILQIPGEGLMLGEEGGLRVAAPLWGKETKPQLKQQKPCLVLDSGKCGDH